MGRLSLPLLKSTLSLNQPQPLPADLTPAGVLVPVFEKDGDLNLLFTQRTLTVRDHRGQISFPGGVKDDGDPDLLATALRETQEEIGLDPGTVAILGSLPSVATITGYAITAFVGLIPHPYDFQTNPLEVERLLLLPLSGFLPPERWTSGPYVFKGRVTRVCYWRANHEVIWGATARILLNLLAALNQYPVTGDRHATCLD